MKYKGKQGNSYLFEGDGEVLEALSTTMPDVVTGISYKEIVVWSDLDVDLLDRVVPYKDIQTAVSMMQILIEEGEV